MIKSAERRTFLFIFLKYAFILLDGGAGMEWKKLYDKGFNRIYIKENKVIAIEFGRIIMKQYKSAAVARYEANFLIFTLEIVNEDEE